MVNLTTADYLTFLVFFIIYMCVGIYIIVNIITYIKNNKNNKHKNEENSEKIELYNLINNMSVNELVLLSQKIDNLIWAYYTKKKEKLKEYKKPLKTLTEEEIENIKKETQEYYNSMSATDLLQIVIDIAFDYDGYNTVNGLKSLIDEIVEIIKTAKEKIDNKNA